MTTAIRLATVEDAEQIAAIYRPYVLHTPISFETEPPTADQMRERVAETLPRFPYLVCDADGQLTGYAYAGPHRTRAAYRWSVDVTVYVHEQHHRTGVGRALYTSLFALLQQQGFFNAYAGIALPNAGSVGLHTAMGFQPVGIYRRVGYKNGAWYDVGWWQLALQPDADPPDEPRGLAALYGTEEWKTALLQGQALLRDKQ